LACCPYALDITVACFYNLAKERDVSCKGEIEVRVGPEARGQVGRWEVGSEKLAS